MTGLRRLAGFALIGVLACGGDGPTGAGEGRVEVSPSSFALAPGETRRLEVVAFDDAGRAISNAAPRWSSDASAIATVNDEGLVTAVAPGATRIVARVGSQEGSALLQVTGGEGSMVDVLPSVTYQTITGWEATAQAGEECRPQSYNAYKDRVFDRAANELGINRLRVEVRSGMENSTDWFARFASGQVGYEEWKSKWWEIENDNGTAANVNPNGFQWSFLDYEVESVVTPMRQRLQARGERLFITLTYVDFGASAFEHSTDPEEYAEFMLATFRHLQQKYGWVPDAVEMILEPDNTQNWRGESIGRALVAAGDRLRAAGFRPAFIAPSNTNMTRALEYWDAMMGVPRVQEYVTDLAYHRYGGVSGEALGEIGQRAIRHGVRTGMLEHIGSGIDELLDDLILGRASSWQQFTLAYCAGSDDGAQYYLVNLDNPGNPEVTMAGATRYLRHVFLPVRAGAERIGAVTGDGRLRPVAFRNANGEHVVVVRTNAAASFGVRGLAPGRYGIRVSTPSSSWVDAGEVTVASGGTLSASIPSDGVVTIHRR